MLHEKVLSIEPEQLILQMECVPRNGTRDGGMITYIDKGASIAAYDDQRNVIGTILKPSALPGEEPHGWRMSVYPIGGGLVFDDCIDLDDAKLCIEWLSRVTYDEAVRLTTHDESSEWETVLRALCAQSIPPTGSTLVGG